MRDYITGYFDRELYPGALRDWHLSDDAGHPDYPSEQELERQFRAAQRALPELQEEDPPVIQTPQAHGLGTPEEGL